MEAWASLRPAQRARVSRSVLVAGLLRSAAQGERDPERLRDAALAEGHLAMNAITDARGLGIGALAADSRSEADGPGWQERINAALRKAAGK